MFGVEAFQRRLNLFDLWLRMALPGNYHIPSRIKQPEGRMSLHVRKDTTKKQ
ncbi:hypothetical protein RHMOL_Rhmol13G0000600 [Rhododendron molle]|uniref:Uncharacterized protein n=1 Tax=Rhododendron molle TaxID=49168 RepID=A0ACC0L1F0_RHOML|nr:hypothetical protein RHMOL_Rhmol13G0000600 [Rhododendron molle]